MGEPDLHSPMAERLRCRLEKDVARIVCRQGPTPGIALRDLCYSWPTWNKIDLTLPARQTVGRARLARSLGRDPLVKYCLAALCDGTRIETWISRGEPWVARLAVNGRLLGRCEPSPRRQTRISRPGVLNFLAGLGSFGRMWWARQYDLWLGDEPFGRVHRPVVVGPDSIRIEHVSGTVLPVNMLSYTSWVRGRFGPNRIIPEGAPALDGPENEPFYLASSILFKTLVFEHDLTD